MFYYEKLITLVTSSSGVDKCLQKLKKILLVRQGSDSDCYLFINKFQSKEINDVREITKII